jgi:hypothetical protein
MGEADGAVASGAARAADAGPLLRWTARAGSVDEVERELTRIWATADLEVQTPDGPERRIAARSSVLNLVVVARRPELGVRAAATVAGLTGRHPSRTLILAAVDPDGPSSLDARVEAACRLPTPETFESCTEVIHLALGGEAGRHLAASVAPLLVHDLPVVVWWPGDPPLGSPQARDLLDLADRLVVDGSRWSGDGLGRLGQLARLTARGEPAVFDFAVVRQARWREAIAAVFDRAEFLPFLRSIRAIDVSYASRPDTPVGTTNVVKPIYHLAWLASRLGLTVEEPLTQVAPVGSAAGTALPDLAPGRPIEGRGRTAVLRAGRRSVDVGIHAVASTMPSGTTLRVDIAAERRTSVLRAQVSAEAEGVRVRAGIDDGPLFDRLYMAPRATDVQLLMAAIESGGHDRVTDDALRLAGVLVGAG